LLYRCGPRCERNLQLMLIAQGDTLFAAHRLSWSAAGAPPVLVSGGAVICSRMVPSADKRKWTCFGRIGPARSVFPAARAERKRRRPRDSGRAAHDHRPPSAEGTPSMPLRLAGSLPDR